MKIIRFIVLKKQAAREARRLIHPNIVYPIKVDQPISFEVLQSIWGFTVVYVGSLLVLTFILVGMSVPFSSAISTLITCISSTGAVLTPMAEKFSQMSDPKVCIFVFTMLLGRLEVFTILILFIPEFWRK